MLEDALRAHPRRISRTAAPGSVKWCAAVRRPTTSKAPSAPRAATPALQITFVPGIPGAGSQCHLPRGPAARSRWATWPPPVATSSAVRPPSPNTTIRSRSGPLATRTARVASARALHG